MRGDLDKINLADIFQTLTMSKMEGFLRVSNPIEQRELYFRDGYVRCLMPNRTETLRLGQRLIRAGYLTADQLRSALLLQKKSRKQLGTILAENEFVSKEQIEDVLVNQVQEDLFNLFTWRSGSFEFYKGAVSDAATVERLSTTQQFQVDGVLLEVARRSDEWGMIIEQLSSLNEVFEPTGTKVPSHFGDDHRQLIEAVDGRRSVRDLADTTVLGLFECGRMLREIHNRGLIRPVSIDQAIALAHEQSQAGDVKRATMTLRAVLERRERPGPDDVLRIAELLAACGETRWSAELLVEAGLSQEDPAEALRIALRAREISKRSVPVLRFVIEQIEKAPDPGSHDRAGPAIDLVECLIADDAWESALEEAQLLEARGVDLGRVSAIKARILSKLGRPEDAIAVLTAFAESLRARNDRDKLIHVYEQILKIDFRRKDIAKELKSLHAGKLLRRGKVAICAVLLLVAGWIAYWRVQQGVVGQRLDAMLAQVLERAARGDVDGATRLVDTVRGEHGDSEHVIQMEAAIESAREKLRLSESSAREEARIARINLAADHVQHGRLVEALDVYASLVEHGATEADADEAARLRLNHVRKEQTDELRRLRTLVPPMPTLKQTEAERNRILQEMQRNFGDSSLMRATGLLASSADPRLSRILGDADRTALLQVLTEARDFFTEALRIKQAYETESANADIARQLTPLFHSAKEHAAKHEFAEALDAFRTLAQRHPADDQLKAHFADQVARFSTILRFLAVIDDATRRGDFRTARNQLQTLQSTYPDVPFGQLTRLPVAVESTPTGADVFVDGQFLGKAPLVTSYVPASQTLVRVQLAGFHPEEITLSGDRVGAVRSLLTREPAWQYSSRGAIDRAPIVDGDGNLFLVDRAGQIVSLDRDGVHRWRLDTGDLSGLLSRPALAGPNAIVVASIDGTLRCVDSADGSLRWRADGMPGEAAPVADDTTVTTAVGDEIVGLDLAHGSERYRFRLPAAVRADLLRIADRAVAVTTAGTAHCIRIADGRTLWEAEVGKGVIATPGLHDAVVAIAADDGSVTLIEHATGRVRWRSTAFTSLTLGCAVAADRVFVAEDRDVAVLDVRTGKRIAGGTQEAAIRSPLAADADHLFVGDADGRIQVLDPRTLAPRFLLRGVKEALAPVLVLPGGAMLATFGDRTLRAYRALP